jgi:hypothetical protein
MSQQNLDSAQIGRIFQRMGREAVQQGLRLYWFDQMAVTRAR